MGHDQKFVLRVDAGTANAGMREKGRAVDQDLCAFACVARAREVIVEHRMRATENLIRTTKKSKFNSPPPPPVSASSCVQ